MDQMVQGTNRFSHYEQRSAGVSGTSNLDMEDRIHKCPDVFNDNLGKCAGPPSLGEQDPRPQVTASLQLSTIGP